MATGGSGVMIRWWAAVREAGCATRLAIRAAVAASAGLAGHSRRRASEYTNGTGAWPVVERYSYAWVWYGNPDAASPELVPNVPHLPIEGMPLFTQDNVVFDCIHALLPENLLDLTHCEPGTSSPAAIDTYVEPPDDVGGFVRLYGEVEFMRVAARAYLTSGVRNAPSIYPAGRDLRDVAVATARERVRRARLALDILKRVGGPPLRMSPVGGPSLPAPVRFLVP